MRKLGGKTGGSIDEKPSKLDEETRRKTDVVEIICKGWKPSET